MTNEVLDQQTEGGGGEGEREAPAWNNLWGHKEQADQLQVLHDAPDSFNGLNNMLGWTQTARDANSLARSAGQAEHLAQNAELMGNADMAERFGARASAMEAFSHERGALNAVMENPLMSVGGNLTGAALGGLSVYNGINEWNHGNKTQGAMDVVAGGTGVGAGLLGAAGGAGLLAEGGALAAAGTVAAPVALAAGLAAAGTGWTKEHGWWGKNADGSNRDSLQFVGAETSGAYNAANKWAGGGWKGAVAGGLAGAGTAIGTGALALGGDLVGGVAAVGQGIGSLGAAAGKGLWNGAKALGSGIGSAASTIGGGIASGAKAIGSGIGSAAKSVGNFVSHLW